MHLAKLVLLKVMWKQLYCQSSRDHGTLGFFKSLLNRSTVKDDPKKAVDATLEFVQTVVVGHFLSCACEILGIAKLDADIPIARALRKEIQQSSMSTSVILQHKLSRTAHYLREVT